MSISESIERVRYRRDRIPMLVAISIACCALLVTLVLFGQAIAPHDPSSQDLLNAAQAPSAEHLLGTDAMGRDILSRVIVGTRSALGGPLVVSLGATLVATACGLLAGMRG